MLYFSNIKNAEQCGEAGLPGTMLTSFNLCLTFTNNCKLGFSAISNILVFT